MWILTIHNVTLRDVIIRPKTSNNVIASIKLNPEVASDKYITRWNFGGRVMSGFKAIEAREPPEPLTRLHYT